MNHGNLLLKPRLHYMLANSTVNKLIKNKKIKNKSKQLKSSLTKQHYGEIEFLYVLNDSLKNSTHPKSKLSLSAFGLWKHIITTDSFVFCIFILVFTQSFSLKIKYNLTGVSK